MSWEMVVLVEKQVGSPAGTMNFCTKVLIDQHCHPWSHTACNAKNNIA